MSDLPDLTDPWAVRSHLDSSDSVVGAKHAFMHDRVYAVFEANYSDLDDLLRPLRDDPPVIRHMLREGEIRDWFASVDRALFNFIAAVDAVADHASALRARVGLPKGDFNDLKSAAYRVPEFAFVCELRNFILHSASVEMTAGYSVGTDEEKSRLVVDLRAIQRVGGHKWERNAQKYFEAREAFGSDPTLEEVIEPAVAATRAWHMGIHQLITGIYQASIESDQTVVDAFNAAYPSNQLHVWESLVGCAVSPAAGR